MTSSQVSFVAKVELIQIRPEHAGKETASGWKPPTIAAAFARGGSRLFRWSDGNMQTFNGPCPGDNQIYSAATIFNQGKSKALLAVLCDARVGSVVDAGGWRSLRFEAAPAAPTLSQVGPKFKNEKMPAPGGQPWLGQLLPTCYHYQGNPVGPAITGLVGELPILIALAALSTSECKIKDVLPASMREHRWIPHTAEQGRLRDAVEKGIVVTIYHDPPKSRGSTGDLKKLEEGRRGAFYRT